MKGRTTQHDDVCFHCGAGGSSDFLLSVQELIDRRLTGGYNDCFPICVPCLGKKKKVVTRGRKNAMVVRKDKEAKAKKQKSK